MEHALGGGGNHVVGCSGLSNMGLTNLGFSNLPPVTMSGYVHSRGGGGEGDMMQQFNAAQQMQQQQMQQQQHHQQQQQHASPVGGVGMSPGAFGSYLGLSLGVGESSGTLGGLADFLDANTMGALLAGQESTGVDIGAEAEGGPISFAGMFGKGAGAGAGAGASGDPPPVAFGSAASLHDADVTARACPASMVSSAASVGKTVVRVTPVPVVPHTPSAPFLVQHSALLSSPFALPAT